MSRREKWAMPRGLHQTTNSGGTNSCKGALASARQRRGVCEQQLIPHLFALRRFSPVREWREDMRPVLIFVSCSAAIVACGRCEHPSIAAHLFRRGSQHRTEKAHQMVQSSTAGLVILLTTYGYLAIFAGIAIESTRIPFPGETMLLVAAIFAGTTHRLSMPLVILAAESFAILGDNLGFWVGREGGFRRLAPLRAVHPPGRAQAQTGPLPLSPARGKVVFFGRFVAVLRMWAAFLAGVNRMAWPRFLLFNAPSGHYVGQPGGTGRLFPGRQCPLADGTSRDWRSRAGRTPQHRFFPLLADAATPPGGGGRTSTARSPG